MTDTLDVVNPDQEQKNSILVQRTSKYAGYAIKVDKDQHDKAKEIKLCSFSRPHMRSFHCAWLCCFIGYFTWFAISPLLPAMQKTLDLSKTDIWNSNITNLVSATFLRFFVGPQCDKYGPRVLFLIVLCVSAIPVGLVGLVHSAAHLMILRFFIGIAGSVLVMCQYWTSHTFTKEVVGYANALAAGWGNLGSGVSQLVMGSLIFPVFEKYLGSAEKAWRMACIVPALLSIGIGLFAFFLSDDCPRGNYSKLKRTGLISTVTASHSFRTGIINFNCWILFIQHACSCGVKLIMNSAAAYYFVEKYELTIPVGSAYASIFGWMNLFARALGGYFSDKMNARIGMKGRLISQFILLLLGGILGFIFIIRCESLTGTVIAMIFLSVSIHGSEGTTFAIVPFVDPTITGTISGIVGAGGNAGAVCYALMFRQLPFQTAFIIMASTTVASSILTLFIFIDGHSHFFSPCKSLSVVKEENDVVLAIPPAEESNEVVGKM